MRNTLELGTKTMSINTGDIPLLRRSMAMGAFVLVISIVYQIVFLGQISRWWFTAFLAIGVILGTFVTLKIDN